MSKKGTNMKCSNCENFGHNSKSCKQPPTSRLKTCKNISKHQKIVASTRSIDASGVTTSINASRVATITDASRAQAIASQSSTRDVA